MLNDITNQILFDNLLLTTTKKNIVKLYMEPSDNGTYEYDEDFNEGNLTKIETVAFACAFSFIAVLGIVGNSLVIFAVYRNRQMRTVMNLVLVNLTISGIGNLLACGPEIFQILAHSGWILPRFLCPTIHYLQVMFLYAAVGFQCAVATERYNGNFFVFSK